MPLLEERKIYKPFEYEWAYQAYKLQNQMHWLPDEINLADDLKDFRSLLTEDEKSLLVNIFRFFTQMDVDVGGGYCTHFLPAIKVPEIRMAMSAFTNMESIHMDAYSLLLETLEFDSSIYSEFLKIQEMYEKHEFLCQCRNDTPFELAKTIAVYSILTEGVQLFSSFAILLNFSRFNKMKGMSQIVTWSIRDETLHVETMSKVFIALMEENHFLWTEKLKREIYSAAERIVSLEDRFIDVCFSNAKIEGLCKEEVKEYIRYVTDMRLEGIRLKGVFHQKKHSLHWLTEILNSVEHVNFFENRATEYAKSSTEGKWSDIFQTEEELDFSLPVCDTPLEEKSTHELVQY